VSEASRQDALLTEIFASSRRIAVVGLSPDLSKASYGVAQYLSQYYEVVPVNPNYEDIEGVRCYPSVASIPGPVDLIDVFQRSERVPDFVDDALAAGSPYFWMQLGIRNAAARTALEAKGVQVVDDLCTKVEHARLLRGGALG
jgi:predicted CoA-binding protein